MKLLELMEVTCDADNMEVWDTSFDHMLARYDGRDSIPNELNDAQVIRVWALDGLFRVQVLEV